MGPRGGTLLFPDGTRRRIPQESPVTKPPSDHPRPTRRGGAIRRRGLAAGALLAVGTAALTVPAAASAEHVTTLKQWTPQSSYLAKDDIDGRTQPKLEPRAKVNHVKKGQWVRISCQTTGEAAYGSNLWDKVGPYYVPDQLLKTYTDGPLKGVPPCGSDAPPPPAADSATYTQAQDAGFGATPAGAARATTTTGAKNGAAGVVMLRFFIPNKLAGARMLEGDGRGWNPDPSQSVASRASIFWDTATGRASLTIDPTHINPSFPKTFWGIKYYGFGPFGVWGPKKYDVPSIVHGGSTHDALKIVTSAASKVHSTDFHARATNLASLSGSGHTLRAKLSILNSVTNIIGAGAWSVDTSISITQKKGGGFAVSTKGNGYPAVEAYDYPKAASSPTSRIFLRRIHPKAFTATLARIPRLPKVTTGWVDPGGGIAALDIASNLSCTSTAGGGSTCKRDGMGPNPLPNLIAPDTYTTKVSDPAG